MTVSSNGANTTNSPHGANITIQESEAGGVTGMYDVVMDIPKQRPSPELSLQLNLQKSETCWEVPGWQLAVGYSLFGLGLALCNLLAPQHASKVCTAASPVPILCLLLQALTSRQDTTQTVWIQCGLVLSACALPSACVFWSLHLAIPLVLVLSFSVFQCLRHRDVLACTCLTGVCLALLLALPMPILILESKWGMTVAMFFACVLCFLAGLGNGGVGFQIKLF